jgi:hypothetical protein
MDRIKATVHLHQVFAAAQFALCIGLTVVSLMKVPCSPWTIF